MFLILFRPIAIGKASPSTVARTDSMKKDRAASHCPLSTINYPLKERAITTSFEPDSWRDSKGSDGAIRELQGQPIITQRETVRSRIKAFLERRRPEH
jgi:hypothetical protein